MKIETRSNPIVGELVGPALTDEAKHFENCPICGQAIDLRELQQVMHHAPLEHQPIRCDA